MSEQEIAKSVIDLLVEDQRLTHEQARRVWAAVLAGRDLPWALSHVSLVEPLTFLKAQSRANSTSDVPRPAIPSPWELTTPPTPRPITSSGPKPDRTTTSLGGGRPSDRPTTSSGYHPLERPATPKPQNVEPALEFVGTEDFGKGFEGVARPTTKAEDHSKTQSDVGSKSLAVPLAMPSTPQPPSSHGQRMGPVTDKGAPSPETYMRPGIVPSHFNLADDEGIPLVSRVNGLMSDAMNEGCRQIVFRSGSKGIIASYIAEAGTSGRYVQFEMGEGERICNRLKVMARIEPWRRPPQKGLFLIQHMRRQVRVLVDILSAPDNPQAEEVVLYFQPAS